LAPTQQITNVTATAIQATQATFSFAAGNGNARIFIMREGSAVNIDPSDLISYSYSNLFGTVEIGTGNYIVQKSGSTGSFTVTGLMASTQYYVAAYEYNGSLGPVFTRPAFTMNFTTAAGSGVVAPTIPASAPVFNNIEGNKITLNWDEGNGSNRIVVARAGAPVVFQPANASVYTANAAFGNGTDVGSNEYIVYNGSAGSFTLTNILPSTTYHFAVYEYNGTGINTRYLTSSYLSANASTLAAPVTGSSNLSSTFTSNSITLNWQNGTGTNRMVVMKEDAGVSSIPVDLSVYPANVIFGSGAQIGADEYVVYAGAGNTVTVTGLTAGKTYHFSIFEYNGITGPVYNTTQLLTGSATTSVALPVTWLYFKGSEQNDAVKLEWGTAAELNSAYFVVERNINGAGFKSLDTMNAAGNSSVNQHYIYTDAAVIEGNIQYRLKQVDIDGRFDYSQVITFRMATADKPGFSLFPNPATSSVKINTSNRNTASLLIYDINARLLQQQSVNNNSLISIDKLKQGVYYFVLQDGANRYTKKLIKQ
ncbi:MAG TPA: T9SS type A sorting domain-containing protein, partial [Chitinophagaceae bacterium]|nr:T9SS type A sorting domain-containing protein [Chitinophagaceae bacterium]